ncbi:MAG: sugar phosphate isomerase/epimerase family protein [Devosia sp.]
MRLGLNLLCATGHVGATDRALCEQIKAVGYDLVEVPVFEGDADHFRAVGAMLDEVGLARTNCAIVPSPDADPTSADEAVRARGLAHLDWLVDCASALGSQSIGGPFHAPLGHFTGAGPTEEERARGIAAHRRMAARLPDGMVLSLEALNRFETHFLNTMDDAFAYADDVSHAAFKIMPDTFHMNIEERDPIAATAKIAPHTGVFHVSENDRGIPGRGHIDFVGHFRALKAGGWDGIVVIEAFGSALPELAAATRVWRPLFPDLETLITEAHDTVRQAWDKA